MKRIIFILFTVHTLMISCGEPKGPGEEAGEEANSGGQKNNNDYDTNKDTTIDMNSGGGVGSDIYKADSLSNKSMKPGASH
jgi:hypothetical protein